MIELFFSKVTKDAYLLFIGNATAAFLGIVFTILSARLLGPENWGVVAAVISFVTILVAFGDLGLTSVLFRFLPRSLVIDEERSSKIVRLTLGLRLVTVVLLSLIIVLLSPVLSPMLFRTDNLTVSVLAAVAIGGALLIDFQIARLEAKRNFRSAAIFISLVNILRVLLILIFSSIGNIDIFSVLFSFALSPVLLFCIYTVFWQRWSPFNFEFITVIHQNKKILREIIPFASWMSLNRILGAIAARSDVLILLQLSSALETGIFAASKQLAMGIPIALGSFATVLAPRFSSLEGVALTKFFKDTILISSLLGLGILTLALFSGPIISLFGQGYEGAEKVLFWLLIGFIPAALSTPAVNLLIYSLNKPKIIAAISLIQMPLVLLTNFYLIPQVSFFAPVIVWGVWNLSTFILSYFFVWYFWRNK